MSDLLTTLEKSMGKYHQTREAWHNATAAQRLHAARVVASNFGDDGEWTQRRADEVCASLVSQVTDLLNGTWKR